MLMPPSGRWVMPLLKRSIPEFAEFFFTDTTSKATARGGAEGCCARIGVANARNSRSAAGLDIRTSSAARHEAGPRTRSHTYSLMVTRRITSGTASFCTTSIPAMTCPITV